MAAAKKKDPHAEFSKALGTDIRQSLQGRPGCQTIISSLSKIRSTSNIAEIVNELKSVEQEIRDELDTVQAHDPELARGLSKLCDVAATYDILTPEELLEKLEFLQKRL